MPAPAAVDDKVGGVQLSDDLADLVNKKIREFEQTCAEENEKTQRAQKGRARALAKTKVKEAKQIVTNSESSSTEKVRHLWEKLQTEHQQAQGFIAEAATRLQDIGDTESERDAVQAELSRTLAVKSKLESLCRQLQQQANALVEERRRLTDAERLRRQELADEFQHTIGDVKKKMDQQANERARLARENEDLRNRFKQFFEQYDRREKELQEQQQARELEVQVFELKLAEQAQLYRQEAAREMAAQREHEELSNTEQVLRGQLQTYSNKFNHFQDALSKSDKVLGQYKRQRNKMQRRVEVLEKENSELRTRNDRRVAAVTKDRDALLKAKEDLQDRCKALQSERQHLLEEVQGLSAD
mmetsp:Transcript_106661/g.318839  ORF Transcript_106661/g.318839 Transcript_106661/m.318839 type:complete len:358 (+) Transcript_106661:40-1113(+)